MSRAARFALRASAIAVVVAVAVLPVAWGRLGDGASWAVGGWLAASAIGVAAGAWMARVHGTPGAAFLGALVAGMLVRLVVVGVGLVLALRAGDRQGWGFLTGFALGFVPLQAYEVIWSVRAARARPTPDPASRDGRGA